MSYPVRYNKKKEQWEVEVGGTRWRKAVLQDCWNCGTDFYRPASEIRNDSSRGGGRFCKLECAIEYRNKNRGTTSIVKTCEVCHVTFRVKRSHQNRHRTCGSSECVYRMRVIAGRERWQKTRKQSAV